MKIHRRKLTKANQSTLVGGLLFLMFASLPFTDFVGSAQEEEKKTTDALQVLANQDLTELKQKIIKQQQTLLLGADIAPAEKLHMAFQGTIILGDSIAAAIDEYDILGEEVVLARRGLRTDNCDELIHTAIQTAPRVLFLALGMNDLEYCKGDTKRFERQYSTLIDNLQTALPDTLIYINAILPTDDSAAQKVSVYAEYKAFNEALKTLCEQKGATYIDNAFILQDMEKKYEFDGIHPKYDYYAKWVQNMAMTAGLMKGDAS